MLSNENVQIAVRIRPLVNQTLKKSNEDNQCSIVEIQSDDNGSKNILALTNRKVNNYLHAVDSREKIKYFNFDYCFDEYSTQKEIYSNFKETIIDSINNKYHICIFAYGQSATGKTYTMVGTEDSPGLIPRFCQDLFALIKNEFEFSRTYISFLEIYNEKVQDLFANNDDRQSLDGSLLDHTTKKSVPLKVREHPENGPYVSGLIEREIIDENDLLENFRNANRKRTVAETDQNRYSSRSHSIFIIRRFYERTQKSFYYYLIDLAGSEKIFCKNRLQEGACINKSLTSLSNVFTALAFKKKYVPYRDSTLTWLLKNILDEKSKIIMIATISSEQQCYSETLNTLRFGLKVKKIRSQPMKLDRIKNRNDLIEQLKIENYQLRIKIEELSVTEKKLCCNQQTQTLIDCPDLIEHYGNRKQNTRFFCEQFSQQLIEIHVNEIVLKQLDYQIASDFLTEKQVAVVSQADAVANREQPVVYCLAEIESSDFRQVLSTFFDHAFELIGHLKLASDLLKPTGRNQLPVFI